VEVAATEEEKEEKKHATVGVRVYSLLRTIRTLRGSANVVLVPPGHWSVPKRTDKGEIELLSFFVFLFQSGKLGG